MDDLELESQSAKRMKSDGTIPTDVTHSVVVCRGGESVIRRRACSTAHPSVPMTWYPFGGIIAYRPGYCTRPQVMAVVNVELDQGDRSAVQQKSTANKKPKHNANPNGDRKVQRTTTDGGPATPLIPERLATNHRPTAEPARRHCFCPLTQRGAWKIARGEARSHVPTAPESANGSRVASSPGRRPHGQQPSEHRVAQCAHREKVAHAPSGGAANLRRPVDAPADRGKGIAATDRRRATKPGLPFYMQQIAF